MPRPLPRERWLAEAADRFATLDAWRQAHPKATWAEIEAAVEAQLGPLRAALLQDTALASEAADLSGERPSCPACGERLLAAGTRQRRLRGEQDEPLELERTYARCPACGAGLFPLDEELGLLPGALTPTLQGHLSRLGTRLSFAEAASELGYLKGVRVAAATARRRTEADGAVYAALQDAEAARVLADPPPPRRGPATQQVSVDGAMVPLVDGSWREVRSLAIGTVVPGRAPGTVRCEELSYFSRLCEAERFIVLASGEIQRRGVETAGRVALVVDGADWEQAFGDAHCPAAVRILDFPHGAQRLSDVAEVVWGTAEAARTWAAAQRRELRDGSPEVVLAAIRALPRAEARDAAEADRVQSEVLGYLEPRVAQMQYATFRAQGLPIGSGIVESANKLVVAARLKGAGRRWAPHHVNPMLALRGAVCSDRWDEAWAAIARGRRRHPRQTATRPAPLSRPAASAASVAGPVRRTRQPLSPVIPRLGTRTIVNGRPTARHPWKRFPAAHTPPSAKL